MYQLLEYRQRPAPWNKGKLCGQKRPLKLQAIWAIRIRLELAEKSQELALFKLAEHLEHHIKANAARAELEAARQTLNDPTLSSWQREAAEKALAAAEKEVESIGLPPAFQRAQERQELTKDFEAKERQAQV